jgi:hypothetical protein
LRRSEDLRVTHQSNQQLSPKFRPLTGAFFFAHQPLGM